MKTFIIRRKERRSNVVYFEENFGIVASDKADLLKTLLKIDYKRSNIKMPVLN